MSILLQLTIAFFPLKLWLQNCVKTMSSPREQKYLHAHTVVKYYTHMSHMAHTNIFLGEVT